MEVCDLKLFLQKILLISSTITNSQKVKKEEKKLVLYLSHKKKLPLKIETVEMLIILKCHALSATDGGIGHPPFFRRSKTCGGNVDGVQFIHLSVFLSQDLCSFTECETASFKSDLVVIKY